MMILRSLFPETCGLDDDDDSDTPSDEEEASNVDDWSLDSDTDDDPYSEGTLFSRLLRFHESSRRGEASGQAVHESDEALHESSNSVSDSDSDLDELRTLLTAASRVRRSRFGGNRV